MKKQILVVDDNEINREVLDAILSEDYNVLKADNGREALDILEANPENISLVILDVIMPVMDGYEVLDIIKSNPDLSSIRDYVQGYFYAKPSPATEYEKRLQRK